MTDIDTDTPRPQDIIAYMSEITDWPLDDFLVISANHPRRLSRARYMAWYLLNVRLKVPSPQIARLWQTNRQIIMGGTKRVSQLLRHDAECWELMQKVWELAVLKPKPELDPRLAAWKTAPSRSTHRTNVRDVSKAPDVGCPHKAFSEALKGASFESEDVPESRPIVLNARTGLAWGGSSAASCAEMGE